MQIDISCEEPRWLKNGTPPHPAITMALKEAASSTGFDKGEYEVSVVLTNDQRIRQLNAKYRKKDKPTNVLSFPQDHEILLGDIILSYETIQREAEEQQKSFLHHLQHLCVHGFLHLLGHDHEEDEEAEEMEACEIKICKALNIGNPYQYDDKNSKTI